LSVVFPEPSDAYGPKLLSYFLAFSRKPSSGTRQDEICQEIAYGEQVADGESEGHDEKQAQSDDGKLGKMCGD
jgi:hypothetical protein